MAPSRVGLRARLTHTHPLRGWLSLGHRSVARADEGIRGYRRKQSVHRDRHDIGGWHALPALFDEMRFSETGRYRGAFTPPSSFAPRLDGLVLGPGPHLFIDDSLIAESQGLERVTHQPDRLPEPVIRQRQLAQIARHAHQAQATLDCDASLFVSRSRTAQMSYRGERGWMPMLAFWAELDLVVHDDFRQGAVSPQSDALNFLMDTVQQLPETLTQIYVRSDSAWHQRDVLDHCEENGYGFAITADKDEAVKAALTLVNEADWRRINVPPDTSDEEQYIREWACESVHTMNESEHSYRIIFLRKERRQGDLFEGGYTYGAIVTNRDLPLEELITWHRQRCNCENHIKELKHGFSLNSLPSADFFVNALYFRIQTLGYNLISALKRMKLPQTWRTFTLKTLRFRLFAVPALVVKHARGLWLKINRAHPHLPVLKPLLE